MMVGENKDLVWAHIGRRIARAGLSGALLFLVIALGSLPAQHPVLNEVAPANHSLVADEDGDYPDWIELYNPANQFVSLGGYALSDDADAPYQWIFPDKMLPPGEHLLIFASGKDRRAEEFYYETIIRRGDPWTYKVPDEAVGSEWLEPEFSDSLWKSGPSGLGYGDDDDSTNVDTGGTFDRKPLSVFARKTFTISSLDQIEGILLHVDYDDGFVAYLNGREVARANVGRPGIRPDWDELAHEPHEAVMYDGKQPEAFDVSGHTDALREGKNVLAIQLHNADAYSSDMTLIPYLTLKLSVPPENARGIDPDLDLEKTTPQLHTNFRVSSDGESVFLTAPDGTEADGVEVPSLNAGQSTGRKPDGTGTWKIFDRPTPDTANHTPAYEAIAEPPEFSKVGGIYQPGITVELAAPASEGEIYYTIDGSVPNPESRLYETPLHIDSTTVVRARYFVDGLMGSPTITHSYIIGYSHDYPIVSLSTAPSNLFDEETGMYVEGPDADPAIPHEGANYHQDWERPVHVDFFEPGGQAGFSMDAGLQLFGSWSRLYPQKSLAVFVRGGYGRSELDYPIFPDQSVDTFQAFIMRNSGQDWSRTMFRDGFMQTIMANHHLDTQAYRPAVVYINGQFWGLYNLREKMNEHYLASHHDVDPERVDMIENDDTVVEGSALAYNTLLGYVEGNDLSDPVHYQWMKNHLDLDNFIDYMIGGMFVANSDWPWNNVKAWRPQTEQGKWRFLTYDLDYGFHGGHLGPDADMVTEINNQAGVGVVLLFNSLMDNETFRRRFLNRYADRLNTVFDPFYLMNRAEQFKKRIEPIMPGHIERWKDSFEGPWYLGSSINTMENWRQSVLKLKNFATERQDEVYQNLMEHYGLMGGGLAKITVDVSDEAKGAIRVNTIQPQDYPWSGRYFGDLPITMKAVPKPGYKFAGWEGLDAEKSTVRIKPTSGLQLMARFEKSDVDAEKALVVNEINYNSSDNFDPEDWIEVLNRTSVSMDLSNYVLRDEEDVHRFRFPEGTLLPAHSCLVVARDTTRFKDAFGTDAEDVRLIGNMGFGLSGGGDQVRVFTPDGTMVDSVRYDDEAPWPIEADGNGATLQLVDAARDNSLAENWQAPSGHGTPGRSNDTQSDIEESGRTVPEKFRLHRNYPNPFNPSTTLQVELPRAAKLKLEVYNVQGRKVAVLANRRFAPGRHYFEFDAGHLASGVYLVRMQAGGDNLTQKVMLLK